LVAVSTTEKLRDAVSTPSSVSVSCVCRRVVAPRAISATTATSSGHTTKNWTWMDNDQKCCTTLVALFLAA
jgi:hypothetical protein